MRNLSPAIAGGVVSYVGIDEGGETRVAGTMRLRWWLGRNQAIDVSPGLILFDSRAGTNGVGFLGAASLQLTEWTALTTNVQVSPSTLGAYREVYIGAKVGSTPGLVVNAVAVGAALILGMLVAGAGG